MLGAGSADSEEVNNVKNLQTDKWPYALAADDGRSLKLMITLL